MAKIFTAYFLFFISLICVAQSGNVSFETEKFQVTISPGLPLFYDAENDAPGLIDKQSGAALLQIAPITSESLWNRYFKYDGAGSLIPTPGTFNSNNAQALPPISIVTKDSIDYHINNFTDQGYVVPKQIANWPAQGDTSIGEHLDVAAFVDFNNNGVYDPENGDYPDIVGDVSVFSIMHYGDQWENMEIYFNIYAFQNSGSQAIENSVFINCEYRISEFDHDYNPNTPGQDFNTLVSEGLNIKWQLGNNYDNLSGSDSTHNLVYCYNGDNFDEDTLSGNGFGSNPPFLGLKTIGCPINSYVSYYGNKPFVHRSLNAGRNPGPKLEELLVARYGEPFGSPTQTTGSIGFEQANDTIYGVPTEQRTFFGFHGDPRDAETWNDLHQGYPKGLRYGVLNHLNHPRLNVYERYSQNLVITLAGGASNYLDNLDLLKSWTQEAEDFLTDNFGDKIEEQKAPHASPKTALLTDSISVEIVPGLNYFYTDGATETNPDEWNDFNEENYGKLRHVRTGATAVYMSTPMLSGFLDAEKEDLFAFTDFSYDRNNPLLVGTINSNSKEAAKALVKVSQEDIDFHLANYRGSNYEIPEGIANWPANGNTSIGELAQMAPFTDLNANGIYEPLSGEYPNIVGDAMVYSISNLNPENFIEEKYNGPELEIHTAIYVFTETSPQLSNSVFQTTRIFHRGNSPIYDFHTGNFVDYDLGNPNDDLTGCDSVNNLFFCFNGDLIDETDNNRLGFGEAPPYLGVKYTDKNLDGFIATYKGFTTPEPPTEMTDPHTNQVEEFHAIMENKWRDGTDMIDIAYGHESVLDTLTAPYKSTKFYYHGDITNENEWNDFYHGFEKGDRRGIGNFEPIPVFSPGNIISYTLLYHLNQPSGTEYPYPTTNLVSSTNEVTIFWGDNKNSNPIFNNVITGIEDYTKSQMQTVRIFPNPGNNLVQITSNSEISHVEIFSISGTQLTIEIEKQNNTARINVSDLPKGVYVMSILHKNGNVVQSKFVKY